MRISEKEIEKILVLPVDYFALAGNFASLRFISGLQKSYKLDLLDGFLPLTYITSRSSFNDKNFCYHQSIREKY